MPVNLSVSLTARKMRLRTPSTLLAQVASYLNC